MSYIDSRKIKDIPLKPGKFVEFRNWQNNTGTIVEEDAVITIDANTGYIYKGKLPPSDYEDSEVIKMQKGVLLPEDSRLCQIYQKAFHLLTTLENRTQMLRNPHKHRDNSL